MSTPTDARVAEALAHNVAEFMEKGPGLRHSTRIATAAKCPAGNHVLRTGLGGLGVGSMWLAASAEDKADPLWEELPVEACCAFDELCRKVGGEP